MEQRQLDRVLARHVELERMRATVGRELRDAGGVRALSREIGVGTARLLALLDGNPHLFADDLDRVRAWCDAEGWERCEPQHVGLSLLAAGFPFAEAHAFRRFAADAMRAWWVRRGAPPPAWLHAELRMLGRRRPASARPGKGSVSR